MNNQSLQNCPRTPTRRPALHRGGVGGDGSVSEGLAGGSIIHPSCTPKVSPSKTPSRGLLLHHHHGTPLPATPHRRRPIPGAGLATTASNMDSNHSNTNGPCSARASPGMNSGGGFGNGTTVEEDRFIPSRRLTNLDLCRRALLTGEKRALNSTSAAGGNSGTSGSSPAAASPTSRASAQDTPLQKEFKRRMLSSLCNIPLTKLSEDGEPMGLLSFRGGTGSTSTEGQTQSGGTSSASSYSSKSASENTPNPFSHDLLRTMKIGNDSLGIDARAEDLSVAKKIFRKVPAAPFRILDAPDIVDDYYLNLISWSKDNVLAVALAQSVYLWNAGNGEINHLVTLDNPTDYVTSVNFCSTPGFASLMALGTNSHAVHLYDSTTLQQVRTLAGHTGRVGSLAWNDHWLSSGSRDSTILNHDLRSANDVVATYRGHMQEVCGLKWNEEGSCLASGGNENFLCLWDAAMSNAQSRRSVHQLSDTTPRLILKKHKAAVKALDWCPFHRGLLASGGGTSDRTIKFWSSSSGTMLNSVDTGSQVCSIIWSKHHRELCSSHGYSEHQLILWKYPTMTRVKELPGHTARVLNMEMSPDGASVVSAAADETLRFWNVFGSPHSHRKSSCMLSGDLSFGTPSIR